jgi:hypothetical protein
MSAYPIGIVGESFENDDGTSRQAEIKRSSAGEPVSLEREPQNRYDPNCVKVVSARGRQIGNISRDDSWICERLDADGFVDARILGIRKNSNGMLGVVLCVRTDENAQWLHDEVKSQTKASTGCSIILLALAIPVAALVGGTVLRG